MLQIQQHLLVLFSLLGEVLIHLKEILLELLDALILLTDDDKNIPEESEREGEIKWFESELFDFLGEMRHRILKVLET